MDDFCAKQDGERKSSRPSGCPTPWWGF